MDIKCYRCIISPVDHSFNICSTSKCTCPCVYQIYKKGINECEEEMSPGYPHYLNISDQEMLKLPNLGHTSLNFNPINKKEWTSDKIDRRTKKYRNRKKRKN